MAYGSDQGEQQSVEVMALDHSHGQNIDEIVASNTCVYFNDQIPLQSWEKWII